MAQPMNGNKYNTDPSTALTPRQLQVLQKLSPEDQDIFLNSWNDPEDGATEPMGQLLDYRYGNRQGPQEPGVRGPTQLREEGGLEEQVLRSMNVGGGNPAKGPTGPAINADQGMVDETLPDYVMGGPDGPSRFDAPGFEEAAMAWSQQNGREPATDSDFAEIESMLAQPQADPKQMILQKLLGGSQGGY